MNKLKELFQFIRIELCILAPFLSIAGYFLFNSFSADIIFVVLSSFFLFAGVYAYNNLTDREEDLINRKKINSYTLSNKGLIIVIICFLLGFIFSLFLPVLSILFSFSIVITGMIYSFFRLKKYFLVKNFYTGFGMPQLFLLGAASLSKEVILFYFVFSIFFFIGSLISDLRDYGGDKAVGIKTLPVYLGYVLTKRIIYFLLIGTLVFILQLNLYILFPMLIFAMIMFFFLFKDKPKMAHFYGSTSFVFLIIWLILIKIL